MQEPMRVIAFSALVMPLEFIALWRTSIILHPQADTRTCWRILGETPGRSAGSGERSRTAQNEVRQVDGKRAWRRCVVRIIQSAQCRRFVRVEKNWFEF